VAEIFNLTTYINPFDLETILVGTLAGGWIIFIFLALIGLSMLAGRLRMNDKVFLMLLVLFGIFMADKLGGLYSLMIIIVGLVIYYGIAKIVKT
jgi:hypothetical protein